MIRFSRLTPLGAAVLLLCACGSPAPPPNPRAADLTTPREILGRTVERYWDEDAALSPWHSWGATEARYAEAPPDAISQQALADALAVQRRYLAEVIGIPRAGLDAEAKLTYDIFLRERELAIEGFTYPSELLPVNPFHAVPQNFALMAAAAEPYALSSAKDLENWRARAASFTGWVQQAIANMRDGVRRGYTLPRVVVEETLPIIAALGADNEANVFYRALQATPAAASDPQRTRLVSDLTSDLRDSILPAYRELQDYLRREYLPRSRDSVGLSALPLGDAWYGHLVRRATGVTLTPSQLQTLSLAEVEHLHARVQALLSGTSFAGNAQGLVDSMRRDPKFSYPNGEGLLAAYQELKPQVAAALPTLFSVAPRGDFEMRSVEPFRAATSPALSYRRAMAYGKNPAILYVDTSDLAARPAVEITPQFLREGIPGKHYQLALQQERADLPRFRRFGGAPPFIEGWGLYAVTLGDELGVYHDTEAKFASLLAQLECATGAVIDTGIHSQKWTRARALEYLRAQIPLDEATAANRVDRILALPGEALACTVGFAKIQGLRSRAQQTLGARFDLRAFHTAILKNGAIPLDLLEANINHWMETPPTVTEKAE